MTVRPPAVPSTELELKAIEIARLSADLLSIYQSRAPGAPTNGAVASLAQIETKVMAAANGIEFGSPTSSGDPFRWIINYTDSYHNLAHDVPLVSASAAIVQGGQVCASAVVEVETGDTYSAARGHGARCNGEPIRPTTASDLATSLVSTTFSDDPRLLGLQLEAMERVVPSARDIRCFGSGALQICWVASGRCDAYIEVGAVHEKVAPAALIALESGAIIRSDPGRNGLFFACPSSLETTLAHRIGDSQ